MNKQDIIRLEHLLSKNIETFLGKGGQLVCGTFGNRINECCAITATTGSVRGPLHSNLSHKIGLDVHEHEMWCIIHGFDNNAMEDAIEYYPCENNKDLWQVGQNLRSKYLPCPPKRLQNA
jgi:hypothetical protein